MWTPATSAHYPMRIGTVYISRRDRCAWYGQYECIEGSSTTWITLNLVPSSCYSPRGPFPFTSLLTITWLLVGWGRDYYGYARPCLGVAAEATPGQLFSTLTPRSPSAFAGFAVATRGPIGKAPPPRAYGYLRHAVCMRLAASASLPRGTTNCSLSENAGPAPVSDGRDVLQLVRGISRAPNTPPPA